MERCSVVYKKTNKLKPEDAAYIAGLIDGEGTITLQRRHKGENRRLAVSISSTERELLEYVHEATGVGTITTKRTYKVQHAASFTYAVFSRQALSLLSQIHPYLRTYKRRRSTLVLENYLQLTPRNGKYSEELLERRRLFEQELLSTKPGVEEGPPAYIAKAVAL